MKVARFHCFGECPDNRAYRQITCIETDRAMNIAQKFRSLVQWLRGVGNNTLEHDPKPGDGSRFRRRGYMQNPRNATVSHRLAEEKACLDYLDSERFRRGDPNFGRSLEDKTIWRELLELELEEADERIRRIRDAAQRLLSSEK
jgi:hypothetical protein